MFAIVAAIIIFLAIMWIASITGPVVRDQEATQTWRAQNRELAATLDAEYHGTE